MSSIKVQVNGVYVSLGKVKRCGKKAEDVVRDISKVQNDLDYEISSRKGISRSLRTAYYEADELKGEIEAFKKFVEKSMENYVATETQINEKAPKRFGDRWDDTHGGFLESDRNIFEHAAVNLIARPVTGAIMAGKKVGSAIIASVEPGGALYKPWQVGKAVVGVGVGIGTVVGSGIATVFSGGTATPLAVLTAVYGGNMVANSFTDLVYAINGDYDKLGQTDYLKSGLEFVGSVPGRLLGNKEVEEIGKKVGGIGYEIGGVAVLLKEITQSKALLKSLKNQGAKATWGQIVSQGQGIPSEIKRVVNPSYIKSFVKNNSQLVGKDLKKVTVNAAKEVINVMKPGNWSKLKNVRIKYLNKDLRKISGLNSLNNILPNKIKARVVKAVWKNPIGRFKYENTNIGYIIGIGQDIIAVKKEKDKEEKAENDKYQLKEEKKKKVSNRALFQ